MSYVTLNKSQLLDSLENQVFYANLVSVIIGASGLGKTFVIDQLIERVSKQQLTIINIDASANLTQFQLSAKIKSQLSDNPDSLQEHFTQQAKSENSQRVLLILDNAHLMPEQHLDFLLSLARIQQAEQKSPLYLLLAGEPSLAATLNETTTLKQHPQTCVVFELDKFTEDESKHLIADFLSLDVASVEANYDEQKLNFFWQLSKGNPGKLKKQIQRWVDETAFNQQGDVKTNKRKQYLLAVVYSSIALVLILVLVFEQEVNQAIDPQKQPIAIELNIDDQLITQKPKQQPKQQPKLIKEIDQPVKQKTQQEIPLDSNNKQQLEPKQLEPTEPVKKAPIPQQPSVPVQQQSTNEKPLQQKAAVEKIASEKAKTPVKSATTEEFSFSKDELTLLTKNNTDFTLQWIALSRLDAAVAYKNKHPLKQQLLIYRRKINNNIMYLVVSGEYKSKQQADSAKAEYLLKGHKEKLWIKSFAAVKKEIGALKNSKP